FDQGAWMHFPVSVPAGGTVNITADRTAGPNVLVNGLFLGGAGAPPMPGPGPAYDAGAQGDWVGAYGSTGYVLAAWNNQTDVVSLPTGTTSTLVQGSRTLWATTTDKRAVENPAQTTRKAAAYKHGSQVKVRLTFTAAYGGMLSLYLLDWDSTARRATVTVDDGSGPKTIGLTTDFNAGAWLSFPINVSAGGTVNVTVAKTAGSGAVLSGLFLD
ncbi:MAG TPA: hypothetical protein VI687_04600, partial [Candidatus Limnocylindrales bacterium]|nr:hypothetical protein [Candidatus Limnocylindrales bacterium]